MFGAGVAFVWTLVGFWLARRHESEAAVRVSPPA
jgi:hypothetical protein